MIRIGDTLIEFSQLRAGSLDNSMFMSIQRDQCSVIGVFVFFNENSPLNELLNFKACPEFCWKSDCENLVITKKSENNLSVYKINFCIDSNELDEYWEINVVSAPEDLVEINSQAIENAFKVIA